MPIIRGLCDRIVLVGAVLAGAAAPSFIAQYRQRVGGRLEQVLEDLEPFRQIAERYHGGSLEALVQHHLRSTDPTFHAEGAAIEAMIEAAARLQATWRALEGSLLEQVTYLATNADPQILRSTWEAYVPALPVTAEGLVFAGLFGVTVWLLFLGTWTGTARVSSAARARMSRRSRMRAA